ncbi:BTAD domain-containing putative transcriptional regulator [Mycobacterium sp. smrl_JER01]|uniref:BTAD domain-containing putative transcriptional regulator n=1 Tax=Mycobacterium sp. smrl_JER01 TaxID=3402633 RepID=UPI003AC1446B
MGALEFAVLGPLKLTVDGADTAVGTPKLRALLAMLVINRNRPVAVDSLIDALWGESPPAGARTSLHSYVSNLRRLLTPHHVLDSVPPGYRLKVADTACDLDRFAADKAAGVQAAAVGDFETARRRLSTALRHWRGPVLEDLRAFSFVGPFAAALDEERLTVATHHAEAELACGRAADVIGELEQLAVENPYREPIWVQLISAYYLTERQSEALAAYQRLKTTLADELGIDPGPTVQDLHGKILRQLPLDIRGPARAAAGAETVLEQRTQIDSGAAVAWLVEATGIRHPLNSLATRIGRLPDNDIVLDDAKVSRHHAAIIDTGTGFAINDLRSANGVEVGARRIQGSAPLTHGDQIRICGHVFTYEHSTAGHPDTEHPTGSAADA